MSDEDKKEVKKVDCCGNCFYHREVKNPSYQDQGVECHESPPDQDGTVQKAEPFPFPILPETEWCGKYKPE